MSTVEIPQKNVNNNVSHLYFRNFKISISWKNGSGNRQNLQAVPRSAGEQSEPVVHAQVSPVRRDGERVRLGGGMP